MTLYDDRFYAAQQAGARRSAERIVPLVLELTGARSVVDVGCGRGSWLSVFREQGVETVLGVDGMYVSGLEIPSELFLAHDLATPLELDRAFDLAVSLEVAEHLEPEAGAALVVSLVRLAPFVLFSAAIPGQLGEGHVNERWQGDWAAEFGAHGYRAFDPIRPLVWDDPSVEWWYAQNTLLYARDAALDAPKATLLSVAHPRYVAWREYVRAGLATKARRRLARLGRS